MTTESTDNEIIDTPRASGETLEVDDELVRDIEELIVSKSDYLLLNIIQDLAPADIAHIINRLTPDEGTYIFGMLPNEVASVTLLEVDGALRDHILAGLPQDRLTDIVGEMASDDAADVVGTLSDEKAESVLETMNVEESSQVEELLRYDENTAGGIMAKEMAVVFKTDTVKKAINVVRKMARDHKNIYNVFVVDENGMFLGAIAIQDLLLHTPNRRVYKIMDAAFKTVTPDIDQEEVARLFSKYDIVSLPVTDTAGKLLGRITVDDIVDVLEEEHEEDVAKMVGSDAAAMDRRSPAKIALLRLPWVLITLFIELLAGVVIHQFDATLTKVILLASFMPIISAISGNTGLQSAAIVVRGIATGHIDLTFWWKPIWRQMQSTFIIGGVCGLVIGTIGGVWHENGLFGFVVGTSMFISVNISGLVGTATPMISHSLGFDPALTAGPFETAFQDVVGITIFLSIATALLQWL